MKNILLFTLIAFYVTSLRAQDQPNWQGKFEQLGQQLPTPNEYRSASGMPGPKYWQQQADYVITAELNDDNQTLTGEEVVTYYNNSPDVLHYLWLQLDQNRFKKNGDGPKTSAFPMRDSIAAKHVYTHLNLWDFDAGFKLQTVTSNTGVKLSYFINKTMMRIDLPTPLKSGDKYSFRIKWSYNILDRSKVFARGGLEYFPEDENYIYTISRWFPRLCVYDDVEGWQNKQFLGRGEFALPFGNYTVNLTVPSDHIVAATGMVKNLKEVLTSEQYNRFRQAKSSFDSPVIIATEEEARVREKSRAQGKKTWQFEATNVRDFAFASSRKFIWDAQAVRIGNKTSLAMSYYPKEGNPLWEKESTRAVKNTLEVYSKYTIDYPYPQATSVHTASIGMEYPMICFNYGRPKKDGSYSPRLLQGMIGVIIHEVGHNFFPMIINNDERQWTWMDEGINSFVQLLTELERYPEIKWQRGTPKGLVPYMRGNKSIMRPLMTNSEQVIQFGPEQYTKAATGLFMLRETIMGRELFDKSFKEYARRWAFKHPKPADFFRTMEDASSVDLDWFWKGWFYTTNQVDLSLNDVKWYKLRDEKPNVENKNVKVNKTANPLEVPNQFSVIPTNERFYGEFANRFDDQELIGKLKDKNFYEVSLSNKGGMVMPVILEWEFKDGSKEIERIPAEVWRKNEKEIKKIFIKEQEVAQVRLDPFEETTDLNSSNNQFPPKEETESQFDSFKKKTKSKE